MIFTSGGTEADNLAVKGGYWSRVAEGRAGVVTSTIEHPAVLDSVDWLAQDEGAEVELVGGRPIGRIDLARLAEAVTETTAVVSVMWANNEVGTVQPVTEIAGLARRARRPSRTATRCRRWVTCRSTSRPAVST